MEEAGRMGLGGESWVGLWDEADGAGMLSGEGAELARRCNGEGWSCRSGAQCGRMSGSRNREPGVGWRSGSRGRSIRGWSSTEQQGRPWLR